MEKIMTENKRIIIIGGVAGGASAAARIRRLSENAEILIFERGKNISFANCGMPYHIGGDIPKRETLLVQTPQQMNKRYRIDVRTQCEVKSINRQAKTVTVEDLSTGMQFSEKYDTLILSPGAEPFVPPTNGVKNSRVLTLRNLEDMDKIKNAVDKFSNQSAVIVGAGYIGLEMTEALSKRGMKVTIVELANQVFSPADPEMTAPLLQQLEINRINLKLGVSITNITEKNDSLELLLSNGEKITCGIVIMSIGVKPEVNLASAAGLKIGATGGIKVDEHMQTSDPNIFAVGDAIEVTHLLNGNKVLLPLAGPANRQGRIAADNIFGRNSTYKNSQGTAICKLFDIAIAMTGLSEKNLKKAGQKYEKIYVHPASHAGYYPGSSQISLKLLFDPDNGKILGAQAVGSDGVDKRIDVLAVAIRAGLTVHDLTEQELCYAPPYGSAKDVINYAGFVASNVISGDMPVCHVENILSPAANQYLLDVRTGAEFDAGTISNATNIPIDDLRSRISELPKDKEALVFCRVGLRGYLACRILQQHGISCRNLTGGYITYKHFKAAGDINLPEQKINADSSKIPAPQSNPQQQSRSQVNCVKNIDARCLQCPGPIMTLKDELEKISDGQSVTITACDPGFASDVKAWCQTTGNKLIEIKKMQKEFQAVIQKQTLEQQKTKTSLELNKNKTIIVFSGDFDKVVASFIIANGAAAMGSSVTMFFTFWGLNALRKNENISVQKNFIERMFGWMMPRGADNLKLSRMNMGGMGTMMIKGIMRKKNVASLPELIQTAKAAGVRLVACSMSMDLMGIHKEELIDGVEHAGVASYLENAQKGNVNLFI
jgi:NADPH-dependent 2,4-dienoyl-CoA reductase/sulfur reductase-like enzyme/peroxiredoxin family protein/TusA-related sulfurtransferase/rhodanese-related sulfurtransferase